MINRKDLNLTSKIENYCVITIIAMINFNQMQI